MAISLKDKKTSAYKTDKTPATQGTVLNTLETYNTGIDSHYYDKSEINVLVKSLKESICTIENKLSTTSSSSSGITDTTSDTEITLNNTYSADTNTTVATAGLEKKVEILYQIVSGMTDSSSTSGYGSLSTSSIGNNIGTDAKETKLPVIGTSVKSVVSPSITGTPDDTDITKTKYAYTITPTATASTNVLSEAQIDSLLKDSITNVLSVLGTKADTLNKIIQNLDGITESEKYVLQHWNDANIDTYPIRLIKVNETNDKGFKFVFANGKTSTVLSLSDISNTSNIGNSLTGSTNLANSTLSIKKGGTEIYSLSIPTVNVTFDFKGITTNIDKVNIKLTATDTDTSNTKTISTDIDGNSTVEVPYTSYIELKDLAKHGTFKYSDSTVANSNSDTTNPVFGPFTQNTKIYSKQYTVKFIFNKNNKLYKSDDTTFVTELGANGEYDLTVFDGSSITTTDYTIKNPNGGTSTEWTYIGTSSTITNPITISSDISLTASSLAIYKITINYSDNTTDNPHESTSYTLKESVEGAGTYIDLDTISYTGNKKVKSWHDTDANGATLSSMQHITKDTTYYCELDTESKVYVYLHADNGTIASNDTTRFDTDIYKVTVSPNSNYTLPTASKIGYIFNGWKYNVGDDSTISDDKDTNVSGIQILVGNNDIHLFASYTSINVTVSFGKDTNITGIGNNTSPTIITVSNPKLQLYDAVADTGYKFDKWAVSDSSFATITNNILNINFSSLTTDTAITLTASAIVATDTLYKVEHYTMEPISNITYNISDSSTYKLNLMAIDNCKGTTTTSITISSLAKTFSNYTLSKYSINTTTESISSIESTSATTILANGSLVIKLYYNANDYTVSLVPTGLDSGANNDSFSYTYGTNSNFPDITPVSGYTFEGFYEAYSKPATAPANINSSSINGYYKRYMEYIHSTDINSIRTLYKKFSINTPKIDSILSFSPGAINGTSLPVSFVWNNLTISSSLYFTIEDNTDTTADVALSTSVINPSAVGGTATIYDATGTKVDYTTAGSSATATLTVGHSYTLTAYYLGRVESEFAYNNSESSTKVFNVSSTGTIS